MNKLINLMGKCSFRSKRSTIPLPVYPQTERDLIHFSKKPHRWHFELTPAYRSQFKFTNWQHGGYPLRLFNQETFNIALIFYLRFIGQRFQSWSRFVSKYHPCQFRGGVCNLNDDWLGGCNGWRECSILTGTVVYECMIYSDANIVELAAWWWRDVYHTITCCYIFA